MEKIIEKDKIRFSFNIESGIADMGNDLLNNSIMINVYMHLTNVKNPTYKDFDENGIIWVCIDYEPRAVGGFERTIDITFFDVMKNGKWAKKEEVFYELKDEVLKKCLDIYSNVPYDEKDTMLQLKDMFIDLYNDLLENGKKI